MNNNIVENKRFANCEKFNGNSIEREDKIQYFNDEYFIGDVYLKIFKKIKNRFLINEKLCIQDNGYKWLQFYNYNKRICLTTIYDNDNNIVEWYFDIAKKIGKENGIPYQDDMYLDVVLNPKGEVTLLDEDEFYEAFERKEFTKEEYDEAYKVAYELMEKINGKNNEMKNFTDRYFKKMMEDKR